MHGADICRPDAYDLVICREVFEHLTVLQVREAVRNICRMSLALRLRDDALPPESADAARCDARSSTSIHRTSRC